MTDALDITDLNDLAERIHRGNIKRGFWEDAHLVGPLPHYNPSNEQYRVHAISSRLALIHSEVSEALEEVRKPGVDLSMPLSDWITSASGSVNGEMADVEHVTAKPIGFPSELADIIIRVLDLSEALGIDIYDAVMTKIEYNEKRSYKHGGKAL